MLESLKRKLIRRPFWEWVRRTLKRSGIGLAGVVGLMTGDDIEIANRERRRTAARETRQFIAAHMPRVVSFRDRLSLLKHALTMTRGDGGLFCEFGVYQAITLNYMARIVPGVTFYGFDSFEGLPEDWRSGYGAGKFRMPELPEVRPNVRLVKGWFNESIPRFLQSHPAGVNFVHIDSDLYSSAKTILDSLSPRFGVGTVIVFDEYFNYPGWQEDGEHKAWTEFVTGAGVKFEYLGYCKGGCQMGVRIAAVGSKPA